MLPLFPSQGALKVGRLDLICVPWAFQVGAVAVRCLFAAARPRGRVRDHSSVKRAATSSGNAFITERNGLSAT